ncbi:hypothetical protein [Aliiruegeria haliotis]|uniref:hypothetical protein n=1 Tax=Aliiruegeria haliotis TaxID=1280846 RepID=UPI0013048478|nr:hypothetical protein [Aliiruegeria haliotis]
MKKITLLLLLPVLAACAEPDMTLETDISEANINTECPVDVSEADRANYPACN